MNMKRSLKNSLWVIFLLIFLCEYIYIYSKDNRDEEFLSAKRESKESFIQDGQRGETLGLSSEDWFVYNGEFYVKKGGDDVYEKGCFPKAIQHVLLDEENSYFYLKKEENRLVIETKNYFFIYDFTTNCMEEYYTEYGHLGWQIVKKKLFFIESTNDGQTKLIAYDMVSGNANEIKTDEYKPVQFYVRWDGAIGMWGKNSKGDKEYCFWESKTPIYVTDKDEHFGWTNLCGFTQRGIILEREYSVSSLQGTKLYEISKDGKISILAGISNWDDLEDIPEGNLIYEDNRIVVIDLTCGSVEAYDYNFLCIGKLKWDIEISEDMEFTGYYVQGDGIWSIWKLRNANLYKLGMLM